MSSWSARRQLTIITGFLVILIFIVAALFAATREAPTCFDGIANQGELGIDCGGACHLVCASEASDPIVLWTRVFRVRDGKYDVAALIENPNNFGMERMTYEFQVFDKENLPIIEVTDSTYLNPLERTLLFHANLDVGKRSPDRAFLKVLDTSPWRRLGKFRKPSITTSNEDYSNEPTPVLSVDLVNNSFFDTSDIEAYVVASDKKGNAVAASRTNLKGIAREGRKKIFFTWPEPFIGAVSSFDVMHRVDLVKGNVLLPGDELSPERGE